jgi:glutamate dehydrogenase
MTAACASGPARSWPTPIEGRVSAYYPSFSDAPLARVHYVLGVTPGKHGDPDLAALEAAVAETARTWDDRFEAAVRDGGAPGRVAETLARWQGAFPPGYRDQYDAAEALADLAVVDDLGRRAGAGPRLPPRRRRQADLPLQALSPRRRRAPGRRAADPRAHGPEGADRGRLQADPPGATRTRKVWVHEFVLRDERGEHLSFADIKTAFEAAFVAIWTGRAESDGFNRLVLELGVGWREAALVRALARYRQQTGLDPSQGVQEQALSDNPGVTRLILDLFRIKFDPAVRADLAAREEQAKAVEASINEALQAVESLDADRVLRRIAALIGAIQRTNFFQGARRRAQALHQLQDRLARAGGPAGPQALSRDLRLGPARRGRPPARRPVARGGLRWSDRRDDFRTEVLGLVKAQHGQERGDRAGRLQGRLRI